MHNVTARGADTIVEERLAHHARQYRALIDNVRSTKTSYTAGAVLLPRLPPGHDLTALCLAGRDDEATDILASLMQRMSSAEADIPFAIAAR